MTEFLQRLYCVKVISQQKTKPLKAAFT